MAIRTILIVISTILTIAAGVPYVLGILNGKTKPRIVTWFVWSAVTGLAAAASFSNHQYSSAVLTLCEAIETLTIAFLGLVSSSDRSIEAFDIVCLFGAVVGLVLWQIFDSPSIAVLASVLIDIVGSLPTVKHIWQRPFEEIWITFALSTMSGLFSLFAATSMHITAIAYPIDIFVINGLFALIIATRRRAHSEPPLNAEIHRKLPETP